MNLEDSLRTLAKELAYDLAKVLRTLPLAEVQALQIEKPPCPAGPFALLVLFGGSTMTSAPDVTISRLKAMITPSELAAVARGGGPSSRAARFLQASPLQAAAGTGALRRRRSKPPGREAEDLSGKRFGRWMVLRRDYSKPGLRWSCRCEGCATEHSVLGQNLRAGNTKGCHRCAAHGELSKLRKK